MKKQLAAFVSTMGLCAAAGTASATVFYMDEFTVTENGQTYWQDNFSNGIAPKDASVENPAVVAQNLYGRAYLTQSAMIGGLPGPEANDKLALDSAQGQWNIGVVNPVPNLIQRARINAPMNPALAAALLQTDQITVTGLFDLIEPQQPAPGYSELYSVRLTDWAGSVTPEGVELAVIKTQSDNWLVQLRQAVINDHWEPIQSWNLGLIPNISDFEQISLSLINDATNGYGDRFFAEFVLMDLNDPTMNLTYASDANKFGLMYQEIDPTTGSPYAWLRPEFTTRVQVPVPEPATLALFAAGLAGMGLQRRKS